MNDDNASKRGDTLFCSVPEGLDALVLSQLGRETGAADAAGLHVHVARERETVDDLMRGEHLLDPAETQRG